MRYLWAVTRQFRNKISITFFPLDMVQHDKHHAQINSKCILFFNLYDSKANVTSLTQYREQMN